MAVKISGKYLGKKRVELTHEPTGSKIITDAPLDNQGEATTFSPTDLAAASLGSCIMTVMAIVAERGGIDLSGMHFSLEKHMESSPRRIGHLPIVLHLPSALTDEQRKKLEHTAHTCPVHHSLHPQIRIEIDFQYDL